MRSQNITTVIFLYPLERGVGVGRAEMISKGFIKIFDQVSKDEGRQRGGGS